MKKLTPLYLLLLTSCSTMTEPAYFSPLPVDVDAVAVYIYRPVVMANAIYSPDLYINDTFKLSLKSANSTRLILVPGKNTFEIEPEKNYAGNTPLILNLSAGKTYYLRVDSSLKIKNVAQYEPYQRSFNLTQVDATLATEQIAQCCAKKEKSIDDTPKVKAVNNEPEEGFSVDKTQNPFSH